MTTSFPWLYELLYFALIPGTIFCISHDFKWWTTPSLNFSTKNHGFYLIILSHCVYFFHPLNWVLTFKLSYKYCPGRQHRSSNHSNNHSGPSLPFQVQFLFYIFLALQQSILPTKLLAATADCNFHSYCSLSWLHLRKVSIWLTLLWRTFNRGLRPQQFLPQKNHKKYEGQGFGTEVCIEYVALFRMCKSIAART